MLKFLSVLSLIAAMFYLYVGITAYKSNKKSKVCKIFLILNISMAIWSFSYSFAYTAENIYIFSFWNKLSAIGWCTFSALILYFVLNLTNSKILKYPFINVLIFLPAPFFLFTSVFLFGPAIKTSKIVETLFYTGDFAYNFSYLLISIAIIYFWGKKSNSYNQKKQSIIIVIASLTPFLLNLITQTILPSFGIKAIPNMGQLYSLIMLLGVYYVIINYQFMQIPNSLITKKLFNEIMDLVFLIDLNGNIIKINNQVDKLLNYDEEELVNTPIKNIIKEEAFEKLMDNCDSITKAIKFNNIKIPSKSEILIPFNITIIPLFNKNLHNLIGILIVGQDIRLIKNLENEIINHKKTSEKLKYSEELFRTMIETLPFSIVLTNKKDNTIIYTNNNAENLFYQKKENAIGQPVNDFFFNLEDKTILVENIREGKPVIEKEIPFKRKDNSVIHTLLTMLPTVYKEQETILACITDITEQKLLQQNIAKSEEMLKKLMHSIPDIVAVTDLQGNITFINNSTYTVLGYNPGDKSFPKNILSLIDKKDIDKAKTNMSKLLIGEHESAEYTYIKRDGGKIDVEVNSSILSHKTKEPFGMIFVIRDITERKKIQENLRKSKEEIEKINNELLETNSLLREKSVRDGLTNLYNHQYTNELLKLEIDKAEINKSSLCLMMLDIDFFKRVNDNFGHQIGDKVLASLSRLIEANVRKTDVIGRYGGEEFIIILPQITLADAFNLADKTRLNVQDYNFGFENLHVTISIGLTQYSSGSAKELVNKADTLLYKAKNNGRNRIETFV